MFKLYSESFNIIIKPFSEIYSNEHGNSQSDKNIKSVSLNVVLCLCFLLCTLKISEGVYNIGFCMRKAKQKNVDVEKIKSGYDSHI